MESLYEIALQAIGDCFGDTSQSLEEALDNMRGLRDEVEIKIDALETNIRKQ